MENLLKKLRVDVNENIFLKDPFSSDLGKEIINISLILIADLGIENFTFKKLSVRIGCTESAVYRYFENKHKLLLFLTLWYWGFLENNLVLATVNITDPKQKLKIALEIMVKGPLFKYNDFIDPMSLKKLLTFEATKAFMTKEIDHEYQFGFFNQFDKLIIRIAEIIHEINPDYPYPKALVSTVMESSLIQAYYSEHLPNLTEITGDTMKVAFFSDLVYKAIKV